VFAKAKHIEMLKKRIQVPPIVPVPTLPVLTTSLRQGHQEQPDHDPVRKIDKERADKRHDEKRKM
jgi:hypothetical protein